MGRPGWTVRTADLKLIEYDDGGAPELFDMRSDIAEVDNLIAGGIPAELNLTSTRWSVREGTQSLTGNDSSPPAVA